jgi:hypothetical protein
MLAEIEGVPQVAMAGRLGISVSGAKSRVQRGRAMLRKLLLECCQFPFDRRGGLAGCQPRRHMDCAEGQRFAIPRGDQPQPHGSNHSLASGRTSFVPARS